MAGVARSDDPPTGDDDPTGTGRLRPFHEYIPAPRRLVAFPDAAPVRRKGGRMRWKDRRGLLHEWDSRHGPPEIYDAGRRHLGEFDAVTGIQLKRADAGRRIEP